METIHAITTTSKHNQKHIMKLSQHIKCPLLSIETILENGLKVTMNQDSEQVVISKQDTARMLNWLDELQRNEIKDLARIENILIK